MYINLKKWTREFFREILENKKVFLVCILMIPIFIMFFIKQLYKITRISGQYYSLADIFVSVSKPLFYGLTIMPMIILVLFLMTKNNFKVSFVLRENSKKLLWVKEVYKSALLSVLVTIYTTICTYFLGGFVVESYIDWSKKYSLFFKENSVTSDSATIGKVIMAFLVITFIRTFVMCVLALIICWISDKKLLSFIAIIAIPVIDNKFPIFYRFLSIYYTIWVHRALQIICIIYAILFMVTIIYMGIYFAKKKEFFHD